MIRVGVAGWSYDDWKGLAYPKPQPKDFDPLAYLAEYVDTIEINSTFYRPAPTAYARKWAKRVADFPDFRFTAKLWRRFTHERGTTWMKSEVQKVRRGFEELAKADRLGAVLVQFPWSFKRSEENREWVDDVVSAFDAFPLVLEVRHASWNVPEFYEAAAERGVGFVNIDQPLFKNSIKPSARRTAGVGYVRLHGRNYQDWFREASGRDERYDYLYTAKELAPWVERTHELEELGGGEDVYAVANNHYKAQAVVNAVMMKSMLEGEEVPAPPPLVDAYGDILSGYAHPEPAGVV